MRVVLAAALALALVGCNSGGGKKTASPTTTATTAPPDTVAAGAPRSTAGGTTTTTRPPDLALTTFKTPSGNIGCEVRADYTRCDVDQRAWSAPPKPSTCEFDWGGGIEISNGVAQFACASDSVLAATSTVLPYGQRTREGSTVCESATAGVTCTNEASRHGFFVSRDSYRIF